MAAFEDPASISSLVNQTDSGSDRFRCRGSASRSTAAIFGISLGVTSGHGSSRGSTEDLGVQ